MPGEFAKLLERLAEAEVRCLVAGGVAVCLHGFPRATQDLDILIDATPENAQRLLDALGAWGEGFARELSVDDLLPAALGAVRIGEVFDLDVFTLMRARGLDQDLDYAALSPDAGVYRLPSGRTIAFLSAERLIDLKTGTGRPKDEIDVRVLQEIIRGRRARSDVSLESMQPDGSLAGESGGEWPTTAG